VSARVPARHCHSRMGWYTADLLQARRDSSNQARQRESEMRRASVDWPRRVYRRMAIGARAEGRLEKCAVAYLEASRSQAGVGARWRATASAAAASRRVAVASGASASVAASAAFVAFAACEELDAVAPGALVTVVAPWWAMRDRISSFSRAVI
jgi:hypothetical protein